MKKNISSRRKSLFRVAKGTLSTIIPFIAGAILYKAWSVNMAYTIGFIAVTIILIIRENMRKEYKDTND